MYTATNYSLKAIYLRVFARTAYLQHGVGLGLAALILVAKYPSCLHVPTLL